MTERSGQGRTGFGALLREVGAERAHLARSRPSVPQADDRSDWRRLFEPVTPVNGESLRGLVARACRANHLPNSHGLLQHLGQLHRNRVRVAEDDQLDSAQLAFAIGVDEGEVLARRYTPSAPGRVLFHGLDVNMKRVETGRRRFSPEMFRREPAGSPHFHRATWELRDLPFCLEGWDMLQDTCWCESGGIVQRWSQTGTRVEECDKCGDPLSRNEPFPVPARMRPALRLLQAVVSPNAADRADALDALPEQLRAADRSYLFALIVRLSNAISPNAAHFGVDEPADRLAGLHGACVAVQAWPRGLHDVELPADTANSTRDLIRAEWNGLIRSTAQAAPNRPDDERSRADRKPGPKSIEGNVGIRRATEIARLSPEVLHAAWEHRLFTRLERRHGDRMLPGFDPAELAPFGEGWRKRREPDSVADEIGLPRYAVEQLAALGLLVADAPAIPGTGPHFTPAAVAALCRTVEIGRATISHPVPLKHAMRHAGGRLKPWGPVFQLLIGGSVPYDLLGEGRLAERMVVSEEDVDHVASAVFDMPSPPSFGFSEVMPQNDALEVLNAGADMGHLLRDLPSRGRNPKLVPVALVEQTVWKAVSRELRKFRCHWPV